MVAGCARFRLPASGPFLAHLLTVIAMLSASSRGRANLPPPPREAASSATVRLRLEIVVNEAPTGEIVAVQRNGQRFLIDAADLRAAHFPLPPHAAGPIDVTALAGGGVENKQGNKHT